MLEWLATGKNYDGKNYDKGQIYYCTFLNYSLGLILSPQITMPRVTITITERSPQPYRFDLKREIVTVGRGQDNDIVIGCGSVSGKHSEMHRVKGGYQLIDVGSTNGIKVEGIRQQTVVLHTGMVVKLGDVEFGFSLSEEELEVLAAEAEPTAKPVETDDEDGEEEEEIKEKDSKKEKASEKVSEKTSSKEVEKKDLDDDGPEKLPDLTPVRLDKRKEKDDQEAAKQKKAEKEERAKKQKEEEKEGRAERREKRKSSNKPEKDDEFSESKAVTMGSGFILFTLIAIAGAFFYGASTRHEKDTGEKLLKGIVNKEDVKKDAPTDVEDKADGDPK